MTSLKALFLCFIFTYAWTQKFIAGVAIKPLYGFYWAHTKKISNIPAHVAGGELSLLLQSNGQTQWQRLYKNPLISLTYSFISAGAGHLVGNLHAAIAQMHFPMLTTSNTRFEITLGTGIGYVTRPFDPEKNPKSKAVGSHFNAVMQIGGRCRWCWKKQWCNFLGLYLTHQSNGRWKTPNFGINTVHLLTGVQYYFNPLPPFPKKGIKQPKASQAWQLIGFLNGGTKQTKVTIGERFWVIGLSATAAKKLNMKSTWVMGIDGFYDPFLRTADSSLQKRFPINSAIKTGHWLTIGKLDLVTEIALYFYSIAMAFHGPMFQRLGLQWNQGRWFWRVALKTHFANADFIEWGIGYRIITFSH